MVPFTVHVDSNRTWGGGQEQSLGLALALAERGERTHFLVQQGSALAARLPATGLSFDEMSLRGARGILSYRRLGRRLRDLAPEIVHVHEAASEYLVAQAVGKLRRKGGSHQRLRLVVTRRTVFHADSMPSLPIYASLSDRVICVSEAVRACFPPSPNLRERLAVIPDFVDCRHFDPAAVRVERCDERPTMVSIGRLTKEKGHRVLLDALPMVLREAPEARLVICGQGPEEERLRRQAESLGVAGAVEFAGFVLDVRPYLASADVFAMPSLSEGLGVAALEAMATGKPVVATDAGGLPESVIHQETGLIVPAGKPQLLADALIILLQHPARARQMGEAGRARALAQYDRPRIVDRIIALYHEVLGGG